MYCCFCLYITAHYVLLAGGAGGLNAGNQRFLVGVGGQVLGVFMLEDILEEGIGKGWAVLSNLTSQYETCYITIMYYILILHPLVDTLFHFYMEFHVHKRSGAEVTKH